MNKTEKSKLIESLKSDLSKAISIALLDYQGLTVENVTRLRREFKKAGVRYRVLKNTVIRHALKDGPYKSLVGDLSPTRKNSAKPNAAVRGMTGIAWSETDPAAPAKVVVKFRESLGDKNDKPKFKTGLVGGSLVDEKTLEKMPGLKETQGHILGLVTAPAANLYMSLVGPGAMIAAVLEAWVEKQKKAAGG